MFVHTVNECLSNVACEAVDSPTRRDTHNAVETLFRATRDQPKIAHTHLYHKYKLDAESRELCNLESPVHGTLWVLALCNLIGRFKQKEL